MLNPGEIGGIAGGGAILVAGVSMVTIARRRRRLDRALADPGSAIRLAGLEVLHEHGVAGHLDVLVERALVEDDSQVRSALVDLIRHAEWEPGSDRRLLQLKSWAARCVAEPVPGGSSGDPRSVTNSNYSNSNHADTGQGSDLTTGEGSATNEERQEEQPNGMELESWLSDLLAEEAFETPETEINLLSKFTIPRYEEQSGGFSPGVSSGSSRETSPIAKAEQNAMKILREAGYRVATTSEPDQPGTMGIDAVDTIGSPVEASDLQLLRELCVRRVITATIMEEATRRMRAENSRLEALLARFNESP